MRLFKAKADMHVGVMLAPPVTERVIYIDAGSVVDFDEVVRPARPGREALTLGDVLDGRDSDFDAVADEEVERRTQERAAMVAAQQQEI